MKKYSLKNALILIGIFAFIFLVSSLFFRFIYRKVVNDNSAANITNVASSISSSIDVRLHSDYALIENLIDTIPTEYDTADKKINYLNNLLETKQIPFFNPLDPTVSGFGKYGPFTYQYEDRYTHNIVVDQYNSSYYIKDLVFVGKNSKNTPEDPYEKQDVNLCNLVTEYEVINPNDFETSTNNPFINQVYIIYRFNEIICYFPATLYLQPIFDSKSSINYDQYIIFGLDGKIVYHNKTISSNVFYELINHENKLKQLDLHNTIENLTNVTVVPNINLNSTSYYMAINKLFNGPENNLYVSFFFTQSDIDEVLKNIIIPLVVLFIILDVAMAISCFIIYILSVRKNNQISQIQLYQGYQQIYRIKVAASGKITYMDPALKRLLLDPKKYQTIQDFTVKGEKEVGDLLLATRLQKQFIIFFDKNETVNENNLYIEFVPTKYYSYRILIGTDITEEAERNEIYHVLALYDEATKLPNQHVLSVDLQEEIVEKRKDPTSIFQTYLVAFDIKDFVNINTLFGASMGKKVLRLVAQKISDSLSRFNYRLYYLHDSVMIIVLKQLNNVDELINWIRETLIEFKKPVEIEENSIVLNLYFAYYRINLIDNPSLNAVIALDNTIRTLQRVMNYAHKRFDEYDLSIGRFTTTEEVLVQDLRKAVVNHEFVMYLQPQYSISKEMIVGFEALIRWNNPKYRNQSTEHFIKLAEKNSLIVQIGRFVTDETFRMAKELEQYDIIVSLNISPVQILQAGFVQEIITAAEKHQIKPEKIALEITETFLMENFEIANEKLKILRRYGFCVHLDDFGTGYSSMLYLNELAIDTIKIDREFVRNVITDPVSRTIITKVISLAKNLSIDVICEGVEDEKQVSFLSKNGCDLIQGYIISKPAPFDEMLKLLLSYNYDSETKKPKAMTKKKTKSDK